MNGARARAIRVLDTFPFDDEACALLDASSSSNTSDDLRDAVTRREQDARHGFNPRSETEGLELRIDVSEVLANLPPDLRALAERLKGQTISTAAKESTLHKGSKRQSSRSSPRPKARRSTL